MTHRRGGPRGAAVAFVLLALAACGGPAPEGASESDSAASASSAPRTDAAESARGAVWREGPRLPVPIADVVVAAVRGREGVTVLSFGSVDSDRSGTPPTNTAYRWDLGGGAGWREIDPMPGPVRIGVAVEAFAGRVFLFGGATVADDGVEAPVGTVSVYNPGVGSWGFASDVPVPVDGATSGVWAHSAIYLVSGRHDGTGTVDVQLFDPSLDLWLTATPISGPPVSGHAGAVAGTDLLYVGGVSAGAGGRASSPSVGAWRGRIDPTDPTRVSWEPIPPPPGPPLQRAAAASSNGVILVAGGTDDAVVGSASSRMIAWDRSGGWRELPPPPVGLLDRPSLAVAGGWVFLAGGGLEGEGTSDRLWYAEVDALLAGDVER